MNKRHMTFHIAITMFIFFTLVCAAMISFITWGIIRIAQPEILYKAASLIILAIAIIASTVVGSAISIFVSRHLMKPVDDLIKSLRKVAKGDFSVRVKTTNKGNELDELRCSFNNMVEELGSTEMFRNDFINNFSHEFKTPIVSIKGFAKQLQKDSVSDEQKKEYIDIIVSESDRLASMASNILLLTKFENLQIVTDKTEFLLDEQIRNSILLLEKQWTKKNLLLDIDMQEILYYSNEEMMSHVWLNILSNAIKFSNQDGIIKIRCYKDSSYVTVKISDMGIGMDDATQRHIFDKFYQGDSSHKLSGNGLGLPLAKRVTELCGGKISVKSQTGKGTTFIVRLPASEKQ